MGQQREMSNQRVLNTMSPESLNTYLIVSKGLGHDIEFKYCEKMDSSGSKLEPLLVFELRR
jgi:hypothetical protein